jgi:hypothetical protein
MASDDDVEMVDADLPRFSAVEKGKTAGAPLPEEDNGLPWYALYLWIYDANRRLQG